MGPWIPLSVEFFVTGLRDFSVATMARGAAAFGLVKCLTGLLTVQTALGNPIADREPCPSPVLEDGQLGAVASESDICSHIGTDLLKLGGNAADAMVGTVACVGVVGMYHSGMSRSKK